MAWRGNNALPHTHGMDVISRHYIESEGLDFVDTRGIMEYFKDDIATGAAGYISLLHGLISACMAMLHTLCPLVWSPAYKKGSQARAYSF